MQHVEAYQNRLDIEINNMEKSVLASQISTDHLINAILKSANHLPYEKTANFKNKWFDNQCYSVRKTCFKLLNKFRRTNSEFVKSLYKAENKKFKKLCRKKRDTYYQSLGRRLFQVSDSKEWWSVSKEIQGKKYIIGSAVSTSDFFEHFRSLLNPQVSQIYMQYAHPLVLDELLDESIVAEEIIWVLHRAKNNKAPGHDRVTYEFFKFATPNFINMLVTAFNNIYENGVVPEAFLRTIIFPIHKMGDQNIAGNYRGISFMDVVAKIFMGVLVNRLEQWERSNRILTEFQAGFRRQYSTIDNIFNIVNLINLAWHAGMKKVYGCFVDFKAAFDTINRNMLFHKLYNLGVSTKFIRTLQSLYGNTKAAIWDGTRLSSWFQTQAGLKQGCPASPLLFALYTNDLHDAVGGGLTVDGVHIRLLLYADDLVMVADSPVVLQQMIDNLHAYCMLWSLQINQGKTKIMVFSRGGRRGRAENWTLGGVPIEVVGTYKYLGVTLTSGLSMKKHLTEKLESAKNAINVTWGRFMRKKAIAHTAKLQLFDAVARSVMCYASQVWGYIQYEEVEKLQRYFLKKLLGLPKSTPNYIISLELNASDLYLYTLQNHFNYMIKVLIKMPDDRLPKIIARKIIEKEILWFKKWKEYGDQFGIDIDLTNNITPALQDIQDKVAEFLKKLKIDKGRQSIRHELYNLLEYDLTNRFYFKDSNSLEKIRYIIKCRGGLISLNGSPWSTSGSRLCSLCNRNEEEDLTHFLAVCPILSELRRFYFNKNSLSHIEIMAQLNGDNWEALYQYSKAALTYRNMMVEEYNA